MKRSAAPCPRIATQLLIIVMAGTIAGCGIRGPLTLPNQEKAIPAPGDKGNASQKSDQKASSPSPSAPSSNY